MQAVRADDQIETALAGVPQPNMDAVGPLLETGDLVAEVALGPTLDPLEEQSRQIAAPERHVAPAGQLVENPGPETGRAPPCIVDDPQFARAVAVAINVLPQAHAFGNVVAETPEIDDIAARAKRGRALDQGRVEPAGSQPVRERRSGNSDAGDQHGLSSHGSDPTPRRSDVPKLRGRLRQAPPGAAGLSSFHKLLPPDPL